MGQSAGQDFTKNKSLHTLSPLDKAKSWVQICRAAQLILHYLNDHDQDSQEDSDELPMHHEVFLGGSCNPTTWRRDTAIPLLEQAQVTFYNPQQDKWVPEMAQLESVAKGGCDVL